MNRSVYLIVIFFVSITAAFGQTENSKEREFDKTHSVEYDSLKAAELGADDYGMKKFVVAFLKRGPNRTDDKVKAMELQKAHLANIRRLALEGQLVLAGPFVDNQDIRGIYIFDVESIEEAEKLTETDPAIIAGSLVMELRPWYGPAALLEVNKIGMTISKTNP